jgi:hypothetical protein
MACLIVPPHPSLFVPTPSDVDGRQSDWFLRNCATNPLATKSQKINNGKAGGFVTPRLKEMAPARRDAIAILRSEEYRDCPDQRVKGRISHVAPNYRFTRCIRYHRHHLYWDYFN